MRRELTHAVAGTLVACVLAHAPHALSTEYATCADMRPFEGTWLLPDEEGRFVGLATIGNCRAKDGKDSPDMTFETWNSRTSGNLYAMPSPDIPATFHLFFEGVSRSLLGVHPAMGFLNASIKGGQLCYTVFGSGLKSGDSMSWNSKSDAGCFAPAKQPVSRSSLYASPEDRAEFARKECSEQCGYARDGCKNKWDDHPMCDSNFYACDQRCAAAP
jgi:hypothetical protein